MKALRAALAVRLTPLQRWLLIGLIAACGIVSGAHNGHADSICGPRDNFLKALKDKYQEARTGLGMSGQASVIELYVSKAGTYTIIATRPDGYACVIAAGTGWSDVPPDTPGDEL